VSEAAKETFVQPRLVISLDTKALAKKIVAFGEMLCGITLYQYQRGFALAIVEAVLRRNGDEPTALFCRQSGKTEAVAVVSIACATLIPVLAREFPDDERVGSYRNGFRVGIYGPKDRQAKIAYDRVRDYAESDRARAIYMDPEINIELTGSRGDSAAWSHGSIVEAETASERVDNEGQTWHLLICDESQKLSAFKIKKQLQPMLASTNGPLVQIGTASSSKGYFFRSIERNIEVERETGKRLHFQYDYEAVIAEREAKYKREQEVWKRFVAADARRQSEMLVENRATSAADLRPNPFHLNYSKYITKVIRDLRGNLEDEAFKMNFRLVWQDNRDIAIPEDLWRSICIPNLEMNRPGASGHIVAGLDVAKGASENADKTVLTFVHVDTERPLIDDLQVGKPDVPLVHYNKTIIGVYAFQGSFEGHQYRGIVEAMMNYPTCCYLLVDSTGMGDPVKERLQGLLHWMHVEGMSWASVANKSLVYKNYLEDIKMGRLRYADGPEWEQTVEREEFMDQHIGLQRLYTSSGFLVCEADDGDHDDYPDSAALACFAGKVSVEDFKPMDVAESTPFNGGSTAHRHGGGARSRQERYKRGRASVGGRRYRR